MRREQAQAAEHFEGYGIAGFDRDGVVVLLDQAVRLRFDLDLAADALE